MRTSRKRWTRARHFAVMTLAVLYSAHAPAQSPGPLERAMRAHMAFLASDLLEGRETGTRGYDLAALYVATQFRAMGLDPAGTSNNPDAYVQPVPLRSAALVPDSPFLEFVSGADIDPVPADGRFVLQPDTEEVDARAEGPLVYAGYGTVATRLGIDDCASADIKGKVVVVLQGAPEHLPSEEAAHVSQTDVKRETARSRGATGMIFLQTPSNESAFRFANVVVASRASRMAWLHQDTRARSRLATPHPVAFLSLAESRRRARRAGTMIESLNALANARGTSPQVHFGVMARLGAKSHHEQLASSNIAGLVEGSDPRLKHEIVVLSAHLDHLGIAKGKSGDAIHNGAMDNATRVATLLETARTIASMPVKPKRSVLFLALTAVEKGLVD